MITVAFLLLVTSFLLIVASALGKCPLWIPVLLIDLVLLMGALPLK